MVVVVMDEGGDRAGGLDESDSSALVFGIAEDFDLQSIEEDLKQFHSDDVVKEALEKGVDLRQYAKQIDADLRALQVGSIPEFILEAEKTATLYEQLSSCDEILASMENVLQGFQSQLGGISDEIKHLQDESLSMNVKLKNRKEVEGELFNVLDKIVVSDSLIIGICQGELNEDYVLYVEELNEKMNFVKGKEPISGGKIDVAPNDMQAIQQVEPQLDKLRLKATAKVRLFLLDQIQDLKKPKTNVQILQQNVMLKYKYFVKFLSENAPAVFEEVKACYISTMAQILHSLFKSYYTSLNKLQIGGTTKDDLIGIEESGLANSESNPASVFSPSASKEQNGNNVASSSSTVSRNSKLAFRESQLGEPDAAPIIVHVAKSDNIRFHFEAIFRSVQKHLMDSATSEFLFIIDFFHKSNDLFNQIFARTLNLCLENIENFLYSCNDVVALLLMIRTTQAHRLIMEKRRVPCLDGYFDRVHMMLWQKFKRVFDVNLSSVRSANLSKMGVLKLDTKSHYISRRYAQFASTVFAISSTLSSSDEMLPLNLAQLRQEYLDLLGRMLDTALQSRQHNRLLGSKKGTLIFRINNLDDVLSYFDIIAAHPDDVNAISDLREHEKTLYIEEELLQSFGFFITFLKNAEESDQPVDSDAMASVVQEFSSKWRPSLEMVRTSIYNYFGNENGRDLLKHLCSQFLLYYSRFQALASRCADESRISSRMVTIQIIMNEINDLASR